MKQGLRRQAGCSGNQSVNCICALAFSAVPVSVMWRVVNGQFALAISVQSTPFGVRNVSTTLRQMRDDISVALFALDG